MEHTVNAAKRSSELRSEEVDEEKGDKEDTTQRNKRRKTQRCQSGKADRLKEEHRTLLRTLLSHQHGWVFNAPIDPDVLGLSDYFDVVKKPMDLGTVSTKLHGGLYRSYHEFYADVGLTFDNVLIYYYGKGMVVYDMANELKALFLTEKAKIEATRLKRIFFGSVWLILLFRQARMRAAERSYTPGGRGYLASKEQFEAKAKRFE